MTTSNAILNVNPETIYFIIQRARQFLTKEAVTFPEETEFSSHSPIQTLADHEGDLNYQEAIDEIKNLEPDQQAELIALMWLGRGDYTQEDWKSIIEEARARFNFYSEDVGHYLFSKPQMPDYLLEGLNQLGYPNEEAWLSQ